MKSHLRIARATNHLEAIVSMYCAGLQWTRLGGFVDHQGFDGAMVGHPGEAFHLEFTHQSGHTVAGAPTKENMLVFYVPDERQWSEASERLAAAGFRLVPSHNPYWDHRGISYEDLDGYRVVLQRASWPPIAPA